MSADSGEVPGAIGVAIAVALAAYAIAHGALLVALASRLRAFARGRIMIAA